MAEKWVEDDWANYDPQWISFANIVANIIKVYLYDKSSFTTSDNYLKQLKFPVTQLDTASYSSLFFKNVKFKRSIIGQLSPFVFQDGESYTDLVSTIKTPAVGFKKIVIQTVASYMDE
jgi:hypothetical protein